MTTPLPTPTTAPELRFPTPGTWRIDPGHAEVAFVGRHFMLTRVRGRFPVASGTIEIAPDPAGSRAHVVIDIAGVSSGDEARDEHLRSADFFDVEQHPTATFETTNVDWSGAAGTVTGDVTIRGVRHPVTLAVEFRGQVADPWGNERAIFGATGRVNREDWGLTWNLTLATGGVVVSRSIDLELEFEAILDT